MIATVNINVSFEQLCFLVLGIFVFLTIIGGLFGEKAPRKQKGKKDE